MTHPNSHPDPTNAEVLPRELEPIARALDRLASFDAAAMPADLVGRIAGSSAPLLLAREVSDLDALSTSDRAAAPTTLEDRIFMATRAVIVQGGHAAAPRIDEPRIHEPGIHGPGGRERRSRGLFRVGRGARVAAVALVLLVVGLSLPLLRTPTATEAVAPAQVASAIQSDLEELADIADIDLGGVSVGRADVSGLNVALRVVEDALDDDLLRPALDEGGAL